MAAVQVTELVRDGREGPGGAEVSVDFYLGGIGISRHCGGRRFTWTD